MKKILYSEDNEDLREILSLKIKAETDCEIIECSSGNEAIEYLKKSDDYVLVLSDMNMPNGSGEDLYDFMLQANIDIPFYLFSGELVQENSKLGEKILGKACNRIMLKPPLDTIFQEAFDIIKNIGKSVDQKFLNNEYIGIKLKTFYHSKTAPVDMYIQISKMKYVKVYNEAELLVKEDITKYQKRNLEFIYVKNTNFEVFIENYISIARDLVKTELKGTTRSSAETQFYIHEIVHQQILNIGLSEATVKIVKENVEKQLSEISKQKNLFNSVQLMINSGDYLYEHCLVVSYLGFIILRKLDWTSRDTQYKLFLASFFHDISLINSTNVKKLEMDLDNNISNEDIKKSFPDYYSHPVDASKFIDKFREIPPDTNSIIAQHHERPDGSGFPRGLKSHHTFPLAALFNIAHDLSNYLYSNGFNEGNIKNFVKEKKGYYTLTYEKPYLALMKAFNIT